MAFDNTVPQPNEQQAQSQPKLLANSVAIQANMIQDHAWVSNNINSQADGTHQKASMPTISDPVALGTGINGVYYVGTFGLPKYYNGTANWLALGTRPLVLYNGTKVLSQMYQNIITLPSALTNATVGDIYITTPASLTSVYATGQFVANNSTGAFSASISTSGISLQFNGLGIEAKATVGSPTIYWVVKYVTQ